MSMNSLSSARFAPPQQARLNPQVAQQREGVSIDPSDAEHLQPIIDTMFQAASDHLKLEILGSPLTTRRREMEALRTAWAELFGKEDGFKLKAISRLPNGESYQLALEAEVPRLAESVAARISQEQKRFSNEVLIERDGRYLPTDPFLAGENGRAFIYPVFHTKAREATIREFGRSQDVIDFFNKAIED